MEVKLTKKELQSIGENIISEVNTSANDYFEYGIGSELLDEAIKKSGCFDKIGKMIGGAMEKHIEKIVSNDEMMNKLAIDYIKSKI